MDREANIAVEEIVAKYKLKSRSHVHNLVRKSAAIKRDYETRCDPNRKSLKQSSVAGLDDHIKNFIRSSTSRGIPISRRIISTEIKPAGQEVWKTIEREPRPCHKFNETN